MHKYLLAFAFATLCPVATWGLSIPFTYSYLTSPNSSYPDSGGELSDSVANVPTWGAGSTITSSDIGPFVGWLNTTPNIRFEFGESIILDEVVLWLSDSDGAAGVGLPSSVTLSTDDGYNETFNILNPAGDGVMLPISLSDLGQNTDHLRVSMARTHVWLMLTEASFTAVPEPSASPLLFGTFALLAARRRNAHHAESTL